MTTAHASAARTSAAPKAAPPVMRAPAPLGRTALPPLASLAAIPAGPIVQRECAACEAEDKEPGLQRRLDAAASAASVQRQCAACEREEKEESSVQPRLDVGPVGDRYEQEADSIAAQVMAMPAPEAMPSDASAAAGAVQRACGACSSSSSEEPRARRFAEPEAEKEGKVRARRDAGSETIAASDTQLTSGGSALPAATRSFFESRMGRDLGNVRVHSGGDASAKNASISARAFTYKNHVWLGAGESASPTFTMAHELAHVMQQTAPGPVGPARRPVRSGAAMVQRLFNPYWLPAGFTLPGNLTPVCDQAIHTGKHHAAVKALAKANPGTLTEVMMPNASRCGSGCGICGFADLYQSDNGKVPGIEADCKKDGAIRTFNHLTKSSCGQALGGALAMAASVGKGRSPTLVKGKPVGHIGKIMLADMKPGHNEDERAKGTAQLNHYFAGLDFVSDRTQPITGQRAYQSSQRYLSQTEMPNIPALWDPHQAGGKWPVSNLRLHVGPGKNVKAPGVKGRWSIAKDPRNDGIWTYFLAPDPVTLGKALGKPAANKPEFQAAKIRLDKVLGCLTATPRQKKAACKRPLRTTSARAVPLRTPRPTPPRLQRAPARNKLPATDKFSLQAWNELRKGPALVGGMPSLGENLKRVGAETREKIAFQGHAIEAIDWMQNSLGVQRDKPVGAQAMVKDTDALERAMFWSGTTQPDVALIFGVLREKLGQFYVRGAAAFHALKEKVRGLFKGRDFSGGKKSTIAAKAARILSRIFLQMSRFVLRKAVHIVVGCIEKGMGHYLTELVKGNFDELIGKAEAARQHVMMFAEDIFGKATAAFEAKIEEYKGLITDIIEKGKIAVSIASTIAEAVRVARLALCASGLTAAGVGAVVTCGLSLADWVASKFGYSPIENLVAWAMGNCSVQRLFARLLYGIDTVRNLPNTLAEMVLDGMRALLPAPLQGIICDKGSQERHELNINTDYSCNEPGGADDLMDGDVDGSGGSGGGSANAGETAVPGADIPGGGGGGDKGEGKKGGDASGVGAGAGPGDDGEKKKAPQASNVGEDADLDEDTKPGPVYRNQEMGVTDSVGKTEKGDLRVTGQIDLSRKYDGKAARVRVATTLPDGYRLEFGEVDVTLHSLAPQQTRAKMVGVKLKAVAQANFEYSPNGQAPFVKRWRRLLPDKLFWMRVE